MKPKLKITKRDLLFFFIGIGVMILINLFWKWEENLKNFKEGYEEGYNSVVKESSE
ncbi:MAG: hypothetical protein RB288_04140 [Bacteroidales bacterium]|jgi:hypothetical protein|nr:hypothetical protein [Bacteroidales bacterium]